MERDRHIIFSLILTICFGCFLFSGCQMQVDSENLENSVSEEMELGLHNSLDIMSENPERAITELDKVIEKAESISSDYYIGKATWYKAFIYDKKLDDVSKAYFSYNEALKFLANSDDAILRTKVRNNLAILNQYYSQYDIAVKIYLDVLEEKEDIGKKLLSNIYYNLGRSYKRLEGEESIYQAEKAFTKSLELAKEINDHENIASVNNQVGIMYSDLADYDIARIAFKNTIRDYQNFDRESEAWEYVGKAYHGIGVTHMEEQNYDLAIQSFEQALLYEKNSGTIFITKYDLGTVYYDAGFTEKAITMWKEAVQEKHNKSERVQVEIYSKLTSALAANNNYEDALKYAQIYNENINDILTIGEKYQAENNQVIFADIIREYDEFNQIVPFYKEPWALALMFIFIALAVYLGSHAYYQSKLSTKVSDTRSEIQVEFQNIKLD